MMKKESRLLHLGILGCGPISQIAHFDAAKKARNVELTAVCDLADDLRERMTTLHQPLRIAVHLLLVGDLADAEGECEVRPGVEGPAARGLR